MWGRAPSPVRSSFAPQRLSRCTAIRSRIVLPRYVPIRKPNMVEFDPAGSFRLSCDRGFLNLSWRIQQLENPLRSCHRRLQNVVLLAQILNGPKEALGILDKRAQDSQSRGIVHNTNERTICCKVKCDSLDRPAAKNSVSSKPNDTRNCHGGEH